ncbi:MAG: SAM-dependent methyltransferase, partial [Streptosporangiaceae bacterium]
VVRDLDGTSPAFIERLRRVYANTSDITGRPAEEIAAWFTGLELVPPGLAEVQLWPADDGHTQAFPPARMLGAVGRRPGPGRARPALAVTPAAGGAPAGRGREATNAYRSPGARSAGRMSGNHGSRESKVARVISGTSGIPEY